jgi:pimeloyl-ACP methyl ester carboxylesterase
MKFCLRLPYYLHKPVERAPVLLFLHGIGEAFITVREPIRQDDGTIQLGQIGHRNILQQGPPKFLNLRPDHPKGLKTGHPLWNRFTVVAPQLPDRQTPWTDVIDDVEKIVSGHLSEELYIVGFSKGGLGAFQLARQLNAKALVTIDASPMDDKPGDAVTKYVTPLGEIPFWAIYTTYEPRHKKFLKIQEFNDGLLKGDPDNFSNQPAPNSQSRSRVKAPEDKPEEGERHGWICDQVTMSAAPFEWLLKHPPKEVRNE